MTINLKIAVTFLFALTMQMKSAFAQLKVERKIIIEQGKYYFFTIDEETQLATMHTGSIYDKLNKAKKYPMPIGRELNDTFNPLCFDINKGTLIGINWILNSNNSRYDAIKKIELRNWQKPRPNWTNEDWAQASFDQPVLAPNEPWQQMLKENNILENCFFDIIQSDGAIIMAICNQGELRIWKYLRGKWSSTFTYKTQTIDYLSLISINKHIFLVDKKGNVYNCQEAFDEPQEKLASKQNEEQILIIDKDKKDIYTISSETLEASSFFSITQLIRNYIAHNIINTSNKGLTY